MRVIVAGSKDWPYPMVVHRALRLCADAAKNRKQRLTVAHGHTKIGCEAHADTWTTIANRDRNLTVDPPERWGAEWTGLCRPSCRPGHRKTDGVGARSVCPSAGFHRTEDMFDSSTVDLVLVFLTGDGRGPDAHALRLAMQRGITYQEFTPVMMNPTQPAESRGSHAV